MVGVPFRRQKNSLMDDSDIRQYLDTSQWREAFELLYPRYREKVFRLAFSLVRNETVAEDLAQEVFIKVWKGLAAYHGGASLSTWIYTITRNTCFTALKSASRHASLSLQTPDGELAAEEASALHTPAGAPETDMDIKTLLNQLPENYRRVVTLFYLEQKSYEEVSSGLGIPLGTVKTLLFRARKELLHCQQRLGRVQPARAWPAAASAISPAAGVPQSAPLLPPALAPKFNVL